MSLKMAKASSEEWERVMRFVNDLEHELKYCEMTDEQLGKWVRDKAPPMTRTVFGYSVLVDNCCDPNVTTLAWKPELLEAMQDKERLDWLEREASSLIAYQSREDSPPRKLFDSFYMEKKHRQAIDAVMPKESAS